MSARHALLASVHIAKKELGLDDGVYRDALEGATGKRSAADCTDAELQKVLDGFTARGWVRGQPKRRPLSKKPHVRKVFALWGALKRAGAVRAPTPAGYVRRMAGVDDPEFLTADDAGPIIEGLKAWLRRADGAADG